MSNLIAAQTSAASSVPRAGEGAMLAHSFHEAGPPRSWSGLLFPYKGL